MAERTIGELTPATTIGPSDLLLMEQGGEAKSVSGQLLTEYIDRNMVGVEVNIVPSTQQGGGSYNTQTGVLTLNIPEGNGISGLSLVSQSGNEDTYRLTYEDGTHNDFVVTNGLSVQNIVEAGSSGLTDTYNVVLNDGSIAGSFTVTNGSGGTDTVAGISPNSDGDIPLATLTTTLSGQMRMILTNQTFTPTWVASGSSDYPYYADLPVSSISSEWFAEVAWSLEDASSGDFASVCETRSGAIRVWSLDDTRTSLTIPTIVAWR